jgi:endonuclease/exonuclease/phosphatase family metal-dependent hydrolase
MRLRTRVAVLGALASMAAATLTVTAGVPATADPTGADVRVGSYNVLGVNTDSKHRGEHKVWKVRRTAVIGQILSRDLDVVGLQEANQSTIYRRHLVDGITQYLDLRNGLNRAGGHYALTSVNAYNCYRPMSTYKCHYRYRAAAGDNRILYNTDTLSLVSQGAYRYPHQLRGSTKRFLAWSVLRVKATGHDFLFTTTHLDPYSKSVRAAQWRDMIAKVNRLKGSRPVIATGDFNSTKYSAWAGSLLPAMVRNGYGDALGQHYRTNPTGLRAQSTRHVWFNSFNGFRRNVASYGYAQDRNVTHDPRTGNGVDWIFASNSLPVKEFEVVANMDDSTLRQTGTIPSDHHMLRATITLP